MIAMWYPFYDFWSFYAASHCLHRGLSPYSACFGEEFTQLYGESTPARFFPLSTHLFYPLAFLSPYQSALTFSAIMLLFLLRSARIVAESKERFPAVAIAALLFFPTLKAFYFGQFSAFLLWIWLESWRLRLNPFLSGMVLSFGIQKPNLFAPMVLFALVSRPKGHWLLFGGLACGALLHLVLVTLAFPGVFDQLFAPSAPWFQDQILGQPTLNRFMFPLLGFDTRWFFFSALLLVAGWLGWVYRRREAAEIPAAIPALACLGSPYIWAHDLMLCIPLWVWWLMRQPSLVRYGVALPAMIVLTLLLISGQFFLEASSIVIPIALIYFAAKSWWVDAQRSAGTNPPPPTH
jgi:hypothetical protein